MAILEIRTAEELADPAMLARWATRRAARETDVLQRILRIFVARGGPIPVEDIITAFHDRPIASVREALSALDADDLIVIQKGYVAIAYPFSAAPTPFRLRLPGGRERYACCGTDALGIAPMIGARVDIRSRCHHCNASLTFSATPQGPEPEADGIMLWFGKIVEEQCRAFDSL